MKSPAFQFYPADFVDGTVDMPSEEIGPYMLLLCYQWSKGGVPDDDDTIRRIARITQAFPLVRIKAKFELHNDGMIRNAKLERVRAKQTAFRSKQAENGAKGGRPKANAGANGNPTETQLEPKPIPELNPNESSPISHLPSLLVPSTHTLRAREDGSEIPTWPEVKAVADLSMVKEESAKAFFDHHENNSLWLNQYGRLIKWQSKLKSWSENDRAKASTAGGGNQPPYRGKKPPKPHVDAWWDEKSWKWMDQP